MRKFKTGQFGTPAAGPKVAMNRSTLATRALLDGEAEFPIRKVVELVKVTTPVKSDSLRPKKSTIIQFNKYKIIYS